MGKKRLYKYRWQECPVCKNKLPYNVGQPRYNKDTQKFEVVPVRLTQCPDCGRGLVLHVEKFKGRDSDRSMRLQVEKNGKKEMLEER